MVECQPCFSALNFIENQQEHAMKTNHIEQEHDLLTLHFTQENAMNPSAFHVVTQNLIWVADSEKCSLLLDLLKPQTGTSVDKCDKILDGFLVSKFQVPILRH